MSIQPSSSANDAPPAPARPLEPGLQRWLQQHCQSGSEVCAGVVVLAGGEAQSLQPAAEWPAGGALTPPLLNAARAAVQRGRPVVVVPTVRLVGASHNRVLALPIKATAPGGSGVGTEKGAENGAGADRPPLGAVALAVRVDDPTAVERLLRELGQACTELRLGAPLDLAAPDSANAATERLLHYQALLLGGTDLAEGALAFTTELAARLGAERVSLAAQRRSGMELVAVSHSAEFRPELALVQQIIQVMQECADQGERVAYPALSTEVPRIILAHARLHQQAGHGLVSVPLAHGGRIVGALLVEWAGGAVPVGPQVRACERLAAAIAPLVWLRRRADRPWRDRLMLALDRLPSRLRQRNDPLPKLIAAACAAAVAGVTFVPVPYRVGAPAHLEGAVPRVMAAPFDGFLHRSTVRPGDTVKAGDVVAELADQDLKLEARKWESALAQHENGVAAALARDDRAQFVISRGKADEARAQLELARQHLERTKLVAPIDGVVIQGELSQSLGAPVQRGDALLTLAPAGQHRLVIEVDERDIAAVRPGQTGRLALSSLPTDTLALVVERVTPVATVREGRNAFEVEARLGEGAATLRPGLQGVAKIDAGSHSLAWIATHRLIDWARLASWSWLP
jgi:hypothetical protein